LIASESRSKLLVVRELALKALKATLSVPKIVGLDPLRRGSGWPRKTSGRVTQNSKSSERGEAR
jgi:hypothetical protein